MAILLIHGGAGRREGLHAELHEYATQLRDIVQTSYPVLLRAGAKAAVIEALKKLEDDPIFNAGTGSKLQCDGKIRMSAALMDSTAQCFSGVINIEQVRNPIAVVECLDKECNTVLAGPEAIAYARAKGFVEYDPLTEHRWQEYKEARKGDSGTVGAVALDEHGTLCAATSTGGVGYELPGRVSDSATVAGTYASQYAAVSCTGIGEQIVNHAAAARIATRIEDGCSVHKALQKSTTEANQKAYDYGLIALAGNGEWGIMQTDAVITLYAICDAQEQLSTFLGRR